MAKWILLVSGCPILLSSLGGSEPYVFNDPSSSGSLCVFTGFHLASYFKYMIFKNCFALGQSADPVNCLGSKESKLRQCVANLHLLCAYHALGIYYLMNRRVIPRGAAPPTLRSLALQPVSQAQLYAERQWNTLVRSVGSRLWFIQLHVPQFPSL